MEGVEPLWPKFGKLWVAEAQRLRDRLGAFQDLSVLLGFTAPHGARPPRRRPRAPPGAFQDLSVLLGFTAPHGALAPWRSRLTPLIDARRASHAKAAQRIA